MRSSDLQKLEKFTTVWGMFLHKIHNPLDLLIGFIDHLSVIFKPLRLSLFLLDKRYQQRMQNRSKEIRLPENFVMRKMNLDQ